jgi:hypothetical protein
MDSYKPGVWNVICDRCGFKRKSDEVVTQEWNNLIVCGPSTGKTCYETRHPQEFVRTKPDPQTVPFTRPEHDEVFATTTTIASTVGVQETTIPRVTPGNASAL